MLPSNLNFNIGKTLGYDNKILISNANMKMGSGKEINKTEIYHQKSPEIPNCNKCKEPMSLENTNHVETCVVHIDANKIKVMGNFCDRLWTLFISVLKWDSHLPKKIIICFNDSPSKIMKNAFYFILKAIFVLKIFKFLSWLFGHAEKAAWLERLIRLISKFRTPQPGKQWITIQILLNISQISCL